MVRPAVQMESTMISTFKSVSVQNRLHTTVYKDVLPASCPNISMKIPKLAIVVLRILPTMLKKRYACLAQKMPQ